jgi:hypothetical protein
MMAKRPISYAVLRGKVIETDLIEFGGRGGTSPSSRPIRTRSSTASRWHATA